MALPLLLPYTTVLKSTSPPHMPKSSSPAASRTTLLLGADPAKSFAFSLPRPMKSNKKDREGNFNAPSSTSVPFARPKLHPYRTTISSPPLHSSPPPSSLSATPLTRPFISPKSSNSLSLFYLSTTLGPPLAPSTPPSSVSSGSLLMAALSSKTPALPATTPLSRAKLTPQTSPTSW